jgi:PAS domain S-box-containing protein
MKTQHKNQFLSVLNNNSIQILLVEDDAFIAITQLRQLEAHQYQVTHVSSGEAAVMNVNQNPHLFHIVLMDIDLGPGIPGTQAAEEILRIVHIPVVFLSSHTERDIVEKTEGITSYGYVVKNSGIVVLDTVIKMALRLHQSHIRLKEQLVQLEQANLKIEETESRYKILFENIEDSIFVADSKTGMLIDANPKAQELIGRTLEEIITMHQSQLHPPELLDQVKQAFRIASEGGQKILVRDFPVIHKDGRWIPVEINAGTNFLSEGKSYHVGVFRDISDQVAMERALKESELLYRSIIEHTYDIIFRINLEGIIEYVSPSWTIMLGHSIDVIKKRSFKELIHPEDLHKAMEFIQTIIDSKTRHTGIRYRVQHHDGSWRWHTASATPNIDEHGQITGITGNSRDIQEVVEAEQEIQNQLREKEVLIHENNHRIKNNIASIQSYLRIQGEDTQNPEAKHIIHDAISRLEGMRILYQRLMGVSQVPMVTLETYLEELCHGIMNIYGNDLRLSLNIELDEWIVSSNKASILGSIVTELVINAVKHGGFSFDQAHIHSFIQIVGSQGQKDYTISLSDSGNKLKDDFNLDTDKGFGLSLVDMMTDQLGGKFELTRKEKDQWRVIIPLEQP